MYKYNTCLFILQSEKKQGRQIQMSVDYFRLTLTSMCIVYYLGIYTLSTNNDAPVGSGGAQELGITNVAHERKKGRWGQHL